MRVSVRELDEGKGEGEDEGEVEYLVKAGPPPSPSLLNRFKDASIQL
jgi:hypothetical protein